MQLKKRSQSNILIFDNDFTAVYERDNQTFTSKIDHFFWKDASRIKGLNETQANGKNPSHNRWETHPN